MKSYYYKVCIDVEDDGGLPTECYDPDYFHLTDNIEDEDGNIVARFLSPEVKADAIIGSRLGVEEDMGPAIGDYQINWERVES